MTNRKISAFTESTTPASDDVFPLIDISASGDEQNKKISYANILGKAPDGSASTPAFSFSSDTNSGISGGSDTLVLSTGGSARLSINSSGKTTFANDFELTGNCVNNFSISGQKEFRYLDADSSNYVGFKAPATVASNIIWTLPSTDASVSGYVLSSNASGVLSWVDPGSTASPSFTGNVSLTNDGNIVGPASIHALYTGSVKTFTVTVASKDATHRYNGTGSSNGYKIDGKFAPFITLTPGRTYKFDQADSSNSGHPLLFYEEADKTTAYTTNVTTSGTPGSSGAYTQIVITDSTPIVLHYQCSSHAHMGNAVQTNSGAGSDGNATTITVADESSDTTCFPLFVTAATGSLAAKSGSNLAFNSSTGALTATSFVGALTGNVTGNTSGSAGSCTGNSATATTSTNVTIADESTDTTCFPLFVTAATGDLPPKSGSNLAFNSATGALTATSFVGDGSNLTGLSSGGKVLKYAFHEFTTTTNISSTYSKTDIPGSSFSYTPASASSKLIITFTANVYSMATDNSYYAQFRLYGDVDGTEEGEIYVYRGRNSTGQYETYNSSPETFVREYDSPGTSAVTIKMKSKRDNNSTDACQINVNGKKSSIFVLEIAT